MELLILIGIGLLIWAYFAHRRQTRQEPPGATAPPYGVPAANGPTPVRPRASATTSARTPAASTKLSETRRGSQPDTLERAAAHGDACWLPQGQPVNVGGYDIAGGWLYVGQNMPGANSSAPDPALIVPALNVNNKRPDYAGSTMGYWPSYSEISPAARAGYLAWLAGGRSAPDAYIGHVFLYFYGLERRILIDAQHSETAKLEVPELLGEVRRLLEIYGDNYSLRRYATDLLGVGALTSPGKRYEQPPPINRERWSAELPMELRLGLGELVADGKPIPPEWALAWVRWNPEGRLRTPAQRCPDEFAELFAAGYRRKYGDGMSLKPNKTKVSLAYQPASSGFASATVHLSSSVPDVSALSAPLRSLTELAEEACTALDPYSRLLGRNPEAAGSAAALALLPAGLEHAGNDDADKVWAFAEQTLASSPFAVISATELIERWPGTHAAKLPKNEAVLLAQLLERRGYGMEPDPRFGGQPPAAGASAVLFRRAEPIASAPSDAFNGAVSLLQIAAAVATADGKLADTEEQMLTEHVIHGLHLSPDEQRRLTAHLALVVAHPPTPAALRRRLAALGAVDRTAAGELLIAIAGADGQISPAEINVLTRMFTALGLDENDVYSQLHALAVPGSRDALTPARLPGQPGKRYAVPAQPPGSAPAAPQPTVVLDHALVQAKLEESGRVAALLQDIFDDADESAPTITDASVEIPKQPAADDVDPVGDLDGAHSALARALAERTEWSRAEVEELAGQHGLLPDGALDAINETALDLSGEPLCEGSDPITINSYATEEMLR